MREESGFTLVEILVSSVIFALAIVGLLSVFSSGDRLMTHARERMTGAELGKFFIDPLQFYVRQDEWFDPGPGNKLAIGSWPGDVQTINNRQFTETQHDVADDATDAALAGTDLRRVTSTITWDEPSP